jgi:hypothetical protein
VQSRHLSVKARKSDADVSRGSGGLACLLFAGGMGLAFWVGAILASHPIVH